MRIAKITNEAATMPPTMAAGKIENSTFQTQNKLRFYIISFILAMEFFNTVNHSKCKIRTFLKK